MAVELHNLLADVAVVSSVGGKHNEKQGAFGSITSGDDRKPGQWAPFPGTPHPWRHLVSGGHKLLAVR